MSTTPISRFDESMARYAPMPGMDGFGAQMSPPMGKNPLTKIKQSLNHAMA
jgi:hypothetical protein